MDRGADRTRARGRPPAPRPAIRRGHAVLHSRTDRRCTSLYRGRPCASSGTRTPAGYRTKHRRFWVASTCRTGAPNGGSSCAKKPSQPAGRTYLHPRVPRAGIGDSRCKGRGDGDVEGFPRRSPKTDRQSAHSELRPARIRARPPRRRSPRVPIKLIAKACRLPWTAVTDSSSRTTQAICLASRRPRQHPDEALDYATVALTRFYDTGHFSVMPAALAVLASILDRLGLHEPAATISVPASTPFAGATYPEIHETVARLRDVLGDDTYERLAREGASMSRAMLAAYALEQIDLARAHLIQAGESVLASSASCSPISRAQSVGGKPTLAPAHRTCRA